MRQTRTTPCAVGREASARAEGSVALEAPGEGMGGVYGFAWVRHGPAAVAGCASSGPGAPSESKGLRTRSTPREACSTTCV